MNKKNHGTRQGRHDRVREMHEKKERSVWRRVGEMKMKMNMKMKNDKTKDRTQDRRVKITR